MRQKRYLRYLFFQTLTIILVIVLFRIVEDKKIASIFAGTLFILTPLVTMINQFKECKLKPTYWWIVTALFFVIFALPIFLSRLLNWEMNFDDILLLGVLPARLLHHWANSAYILMMLVSVLAWVRKEK